MSRLTETHEVYQSLALAADRFNGDPASGTINLAQYNAVTFVVSQAASTSTGSVDFTVEECTSSTGAGATAIAFSYNLKQVGSAFGGLTAATATGVNVDGSATGSVLAIEVQNDELSDGSNYVRVQCTESTVVAPTAVVGGITGIVHGSRYKGTGMPSALT